MVLPDTKNVKLSILTIFLVFILFGSTCTSDITSIQTRNKSLSFEETNNLEKIISIESNRDIHDILVIVPSGKLYYEDYTELNTDARFYPLVATPLAVYYENDIQHIAPLLIADKNDISDAISHVLELFGAEDTYQFPEGDIENISKDVALKFWNNSDAVLAIENSDGGYQQGLMAVPLASYLNIPVIIGNPSDILEDLECKYVILVGDIPIQNISFIKLSGREAIISYVLTTCKAKFDSVNYIALANPLDTCPIRIINRTELLNENGVTKAKLFLSKSFEKVDIFNYTVQPGNQTIKFYLNFDYNRLFNRLSRFNNGFHLTFYDEEGGGNLYNHLMGSLFFTNSQAYKDGEAYFELDLIDNPGNYQVKLNSFGKKKKNWQLTIESEEIDTNIRPQTPFLSTLAPYLASCRKGIVLADYNFSKNIAGKTGNLIRRYVKEDLNTEAQDAARRDCNYTANILNQTFELMKSYGVYDSYLTDSPYLGIIADTNMIPMYYGSSVTPNDNQSWETLGQPGDNRLADIDGDGTDLNCTLELAVGRIMGWDAQDVSALIARTIFYKEIVDKTVGLQMPSSWYKTSTLVSSGRPFFLLKLAKYLKSHKFKINKYCFLLPKLINKKNKIYSDISKSNLVHSLGLGKYYGFYYTGQENRNGPNLVVSDVIEKQFGPSILAGIGCTTGLTDGVPLRCTISMALLHSGFNSVFTATRVDNMRTNELFARKTNKSGWSNFDYPQKMISLWIEDLLGKDGSVGIATRNAKNNFASYYLNREKWQNICENDDTEYNETREEFLHYVLYGDPAFNPYEPIN